MCMISSAIAGTADNEPVEGFELYQGESLTREQEFDNWALGGAKQPSWLAPRGNKTGRLLTGWLPNLSRTQRRQQWNDQRHDAFIEEYRKPYKSLSINPTPKPSAPGSSGSGKFYSEISRSGRGS